jgi:hypothetical protein
VDGAGGGVSARVPFEYALLRCVPRVDRGELVNVGVLLYCQERGLLAAAVHIDEARVRALEPAIDLEAVAAATRAIEAVCAGDPAAGPAAARPPGARFRWLAAPRSTVVQAGPVHTGITADPEAELERLLERLVR